MEILLDTADVEEIEEYMRNYAVDGITTNPTILAKAAVKSNQYNFLAHMEEIKRRIGDRQLHIQVTGITWEEMLKEGEFLVKKLGRGIFVKVPTTENGIHAMKELHRKGIRTTATAIYTTQQAVLAATAGADYVAPYFNRMNNLNMDSKKIIEEIASIYKTHRKETKILAASFKNTNQIIESLSAGAHAVTVSGELLRQMVTNPIIETAVTEFGKDWSQTYGNKRIYEL